MRKVPLFINVFCYYYVLNGCNTEIFPAKQSIVTCNNTCDTCQITCNNVDQCKEITLYSGALNTTINCISTTACSNAQFYIGNTGAYPDNIYNIVTIICNGVSACKSMTINVDGYFKYGGMVKLVGNDVDTLADSTLNINITTNSEYYFDLYCGMVYTQCKNVKYKCTGVNCRCDNDVYMDELSPNCEQIIFNNMISRDPTIQTINPTIRTNQSTTNTKTPTVSTLSPSMYPTHLPSITPSTYQTVTPSPYPTNLPSIAPTVIPTNTPTIEPTILQSNDVNNTNTIHNVKTKTKKISILLIIIGSLIATLVCILLFSIIAICFHISNKKVVEMASIITTEEERRVKVPKETCSAESAQIYQENMVKNISYYVDKVSSMNDDVLSILSEHEGETPDNITK